MTNHALMKTKKNGENKTVSNYRPMSVITTFSSMWQMLTFYRIYNF